MVRKVVTEISIPMKFTQLVLLFRNHHSTSHSSCPSFSLEVKVTVSSTQEPPVGESISHIHVMRIMIKNGEAPETLYLEVLIQLNVTPVRGWGEIREKRGVWILLPIP